MRRITIGKILSLGMPKAPQGNILGRLKRLSLGMPRKASPLLFQIIGMSQLLFCSHDMRKFLERHVPFIFLLALHHDGLGKSMVDL